MARRKVLTDEQREEYRDWNKMRIKVGNLVRRRKDIDRSCCICGKPNADILHNMKDPYYIGFICKECRKDKSNMVIAEESRIDIATKLARRNTQISKFSNEAIIRIVVGYMNEQTNIQQYCEKTGISRYQFKQIVDEYDKKFPNQHIKELIKNKKIVKRKPTTTKGRKNRTKVSTKINDKK